jgi:hypothetical protein
MDCHLKTVLDNELESLFKWKPDAITLELQKGPDGVVAEVNLVDIISNIQKQGGRAYLNDPDNLFHLLSNFNTNSKEVRKDVVRLFVKACKATGNEIRSKGLDSRDNKLTLICKRSRKYSGQQSKKNIELSNVRKGQAKSTETGEVINPMMNPHSGQTFKKPFKERDATTERPKVAKPCPFSIVIQWEPTTYDPNAGRWYICGGNMIHEGHLQKDENEIQVLSNHHDDQNKRLALSAMQIHLGGGFATQALVNNHHQAFFMPSQLQNLKSDPGPIGMSPTKKAYLRTKTQCQQRRNNSSEMYSRCWRKLSACLSMHWKMRARQRLGTALSLRSKARARMRACLHVTLMRQRLGTATRKIVLLRLTLKNRQAKS